MQFFDERSNSIVLLDGLAIAAFTQHEVTADDALSAARREIRLTSILSRAGLERSERLVSGRF